MKHFDGRFMWQQILNVNIIVSLQIPQHFPHIDHAALSTCRHIFTVLAEPVRPNSAHWLLWTLCVIVLNLDAGCRIHLGGIHSQRLSQYNATKSFVCFDFRFDLFLHRVITLAVHHSLTCNLTFTYGFSCGGVSW